MRKIKKVITLVLATSMVVGLLTGCGSSKSDAITLTVYSQLANYS